MRLPVYDKDGNRTDEILEFDEKIFGEEVKKALLKEAVLMYEARKRQGTHSTKTRSDCAGSGRKLWRQKGTGRARVGPARAPHWKGGGTVFGPHPRDYGYAIPKKAKRKATDSAWLAKFQDREVLVIEDFELEAPKTSVVYNVLSTLGIVKNKTLIGTSQERDNVLLRSARNIPRTSVDIVSRLNAYSLLYNNKILLTKKAFNELIQNRNGEVKSLKRESLYKK
ncbi:50S ribosomal protein L4 [Candidatus Uabimicrobium amorphum]|uniref:Large ribosomal subunit protein uL4 n=1 Tax=Uabimicrobium amorphum TaxID=2596890 RepID=A0A5S9IR09_UABAM|nr:50S ribosomal protein L4 [Candidatus Uabimicrobium amorphum]BBM85580.1 50S ribosomal protein L4 [Candidatus Uabimicrobium amorphum]